MQLQFATKIKTPWLFPFSEEHLSDLWFVFDPESCCCCMKGDQPSKIKTLSLSLADLYEHKFINCRLINSTFLKEKEGCHLDFEEDNDFLIYLVSFLGSLSVLPGNIISALLMDKIGRIKMIGEWGRWVYGTGRGWKHHSAKNQGQCEGLAASAHTNASQDGSGGDESFPYQTEQKGKDLGVRQVIYSVAVGKLPAPRLLTLLFCVSICDILLFYFGFYVEACMFIQCSAQQGRSWSRTSWCCWVDADVHSTLYK